MIKVEGLKNTFFSLLSFALVTAAAAPAIAAPAANSTQVKVVQKSDSTVAQKDKKVVKSSKSEVKKTQKSTCSKNAKVSKKNSKSAYNAAGKSAADAKLVSLDLVNADLIYVLKILAKELGMNIVTDPTVQGSVTMTLKDVPASGALNIVVKMSGYDYKRVDNTIVVGDPKLLATIPSNIMNVKKGTEITQAIPLEHAKAADIASMVSASYPDAKVQSDPRGTALIVSADPDSMKAIRSFVSQLDYDVPAPIPPRTEIVALKAAKGEEILPILQKLVPTLSYDVDKRLNSLILTGDEASVSLCKDYLEQLDAHLQQIALDVKVVDLTEAGSKSFGGQWGTSSDNIGGGILVDTTLTEFPSNKSGGWNGDYSFVNGEIPKYDAQNGLTYEPNIMKYSDTWNPIPTYGSGTQGQNYPIPIGYFTRSGLLLQFQLQALISATEAKVLASPRLTTKSGEKAEVHIGERYPIVYYDPRAGQYQVQYVDIGTNLELTATVLSDGYVEMNIKPDISNLLGLVNDQYPRTANRTANITMRVKDGDTMVLAGLLREDEQKTTRKVPLLGDIPIIGYLFKTESVDKTKNEVVIMVTPQVLVD
jgi:type II secretory pathway component GspD/PulD (secretin)